VFNCHDLFGEKSALVFRAAVADHVLRCWARLKSAAPSERNI